MRVRRERACSRCIGLVLGAVVLAAGCSPPAGLKFPRQRYASAEQVELNFLDKTFVLGDSDTIAKVRPPDWPKDRWMELPYWLGINVLAPGVQAPREGAYYVVSEAKLQKPLNAPGEWIIEAGSQLVKQETVFVETRTRYEESGKMLPTIVQYTGNRTFVRGDGKKVELPVLREVSLPMKWTLKGSIPAGYAHYKLQ
jgi:hypothetical protein